MDGIIRYMMIWEMDSNHIIAHLHVRGLAEWEELATEKTEIGETGRLKAELNEHRVRWMC